MADEFRVEWSPFAIRELEGLIDCVATSPGPGAAVELGEKLLQRADSLVDYPRRGRIVPELKHWRRVAGSGADRAPLPDRFRIEGSKVGIVALFDGRRDLQELRINRALE